MTTITNAYYIAQYHFHRQIRSSALWIFLLLGIICPFLVHWDSKNFTVEFVGQNIGLSSEKGHNETLIYVFYSLFTTIGWLPGVFFIFGRVLIPVTMSYSVSQSLWIRLSSVSSTTLAISRILQAFFASVLIAGISMLWAILYAFYHHIELWSLLKASYGIVAYTLFSSGIIIFISGKPTTSIERRISFVILAISVPVLLYLIGNDSGIAARFHGFLPYAVPLGNKDLSYNTIKSFKTASVVGIILMCLPLFKNIFLSQLKN